MAATPFFVPSLAVLKQRLRLSGAQQTDAEEIIQEAVRKARGRIFGSLGASTANTIKALPLVEDPTTDDGIKRMNAVSLEVLIVKLFLLCDLPLLFMDTSGIVKQSWNEEGLTRNLDFDSIQELKNLLNSQIEDLLAELVDDSDSGGSVTATTFGPYEVPAIPGASIIPTGI